MADAAALEIVERRVAAELRRERAAGQPLKAAFHAVARRLGLSPRRVRAYHHREVEAEDVRAAELLAAHAAMREELDALCARLDAIRGLIGVEIPGATGRWPGEAMAQARGSRGGEGGVLAAGRGLAARPAGGSP
ncbi:hypothetical protein GXW77_18135 [Roseomonas alkaliterrae]|uniref:hypothetical protein n=1 Tax=Neoroseomonas alkaliterrae TaxID=1452450 RepID=UPI001BAA3539|nr:hypothetical protein [Neoroseomonas alkaliterrae]MBR0678094.1 hypothetical protein [Neoroseomonas alkaliterrae]